MRYLVLVVDAGGFRDKQVERLRALAQKMGEKALQTKQIVLLQPMTPHDRRIVHIRSRASRSRPLRDMSTFISSMACDGLSD